MSKENKKNNAFNKLWNWLGEQITDLSIFHNNPVSYLEKEKEQIIKEERIKAILGEDYEQFKDIYDNSLNLKVDIKMEQCFDDKKIETNSVRTFNPKASVKRFDFEVNEPPVNFVEDKDPEMYGKIIDGKWVNESKKSNELSKNNQIPSSNTSITGSGNIVDPDKSQGRK